MTTTTFQAVLDTATALQKESEHEGKSRISTRTARALAQLNFNLLQEVMEHSPEELVKMRGIGDEAIRELSWVAWDWLREKLEEEFKQEFPEQS